MSPTYWHWTQYQQAIKSNGWELIGLRIAKWTETKKKPLLPSTLFRRGKGDNLTRITLSGFLFYFSAYFALSPDFRGRWRSCTWHYHWPSLLRWEIEIKNILKETRERALLSSIFHQLVGDNRNIIGNILQTKLIRIF